MGKVYGQLFFFFNFVNQNHASFCPWVSKIHFLPREHEQGHEKTPIVLLVWF